MKCAVDRMPSKKDRKDKIPSFLKLLCKNSGSAPAAVTGKNAALRRFDEVQKFNDFRQLRNFRFGFGNRIAHAQPMTEENIIEVFDGTDRFL